MPVIDRMDDAGKAVGFFVDNLHLEDLNPINCDASAPGYATIISCIMSYPAKEPSPAAGGPIRWRLPGCS